MTEDETRILSHQLDRLERMLIRCEAEDNAERRKRSALRRQKKREEEEKLRGPDTPDNDAKH